MHVPYISHSTGKKPENPLIFEGDCWVYYIENVHEYQPPQSDMVDGENPEEQPQQWEYTVTEKVLLIEHVRRMEKTQAETQAVNDEAFLELDADICNLYDIVGGGET